MDLRLTRPPRRGYRSAGGARRRAAAPRRPPPVRHGGRVRAVVARAARPVQPPAPASQPRSARRRRVASRESRPAGAIAAPREPARGARAGSAPPGPRPRAEPPARRSRARCRSQPRPRRPLSRPIDPRRPAAPRLRPVFLWARQVDGALAEVRCEDYDERNRIRIARTPAGWRVIPRTAIYDAIRVPRAPAPAPAPAPPPARRAPREPRRRARGRRRRPARRRPSPPRACAEPWPPPDVESHIPTHTIAVAARAPEPPPEPPPESPPATAPAPPEPTPLDNLLAVAELEFNQQRSCKDAGDFDLELDAAASGLHSQLGKYDFLPEDVCDRDIMSFAIEDPPKDSAADEIFFEQKPCDPVEHIPDENAYQNNIVVHKDLFETISEAHYLPDLDGPHDEALLESLVEKGCEDNQILGQALDKLAHLVHGAPDYGEEEDDMLLSGAPVADIIHRLEQSLESPGRSSMTAAQGLLHLHHIGDHLPPPQQHEEHTTEQAYMTEEMFSQNTPTEDTMENLNIQTSIENIEEKVEQSYENEVDKDLETAVNISMSDVVLAESVHETSFDEKSDVLQQHTLPDQSDITVASEIINEDIGTLSENVTEMQPEMDENATTCDEHFESTVEPETDLNFNKEGMDSPESEELLPTDLSLKHVMETNDIVPCVIASAAETTNTMEDNLSEKSDEQPKDLSLHKRLPTPQASPKRLDIPRAPSRESDAMQSPQPSGIPAVPSSPELFSMPQSKSNKTMFLESLLSSPSPKMYTSEVTITKQQCEPLNLGKHRKSASPTVSSCSDEIKKLNRDYGEPQEKRIKRESMEELAKLNKVFSKSHDEVTESKQKKTDRHSNKSNDDISPLKQLQTLKSNSDFNIPDPLLVPKDKLNDIIEAPGKEIPTLLFQRPELRLPEAFAFPAVLQDPDILVISLSQLENILVNNAKKASSLPSPKPKDNKVGKTSSSSEQSQLNNQSDSLPKPIASMDALAGDIDAASAALNQMLWLPYLSQLEAAMACSQNMDFLKALNSSGYSGHNYPELSQMFNPSSRFMGPGGFPMMPPMDYDNRLQFAMWQEAINQANSNSSQRPKPPSMEAQMKELAAKSADVQNPYVHSTKSHSQSKSHSSARTSPIAHNYNTSCQRSNMNHNPFLQGMYHPAMNPSGRSNMPLPGLQIPYFNQSMMGNQRSPRNHNQQKSPTSPYFPNNNYLQSVKQSETMQQQRSASSGSQDGQRPRISVKSLQNLLDPAAAAASGVGASGRRPANAGMGRRREEPEVGSTTPLGEPPTHLQPHPHDPIHHLWHPLFGNQKGYNSPWSWTTVTATGD